MFDDQSPFQICCFDQLKALSNPPFESCQVHILLSHFSPNLKVSTSHFPNIHFNVLIVLFGFHHFLEFQFAFKNLTIELISLLFETEPHFVESHSIENAQIFFTQLFKDGAENEDVPELREDEFTVIHQNTLIVILLIHRPFINTAQIKTQTRLSLTSLLSDFHPHFEYGVVDMCALARTLHISAVCCFVSVEYPQKHRFRINVGLVTIEKRSKENVDFFHFASFVILESMGNYRNARRVNDERKLDHCESCEKLKNIF